MQIKLTLYFENDLVKLTGSQNIMLQKFSEDKT